MSYARIVPRDPNGCAPQVTHGTQVWVGDERLTGVLKIELVAETQDIWRAIIHCAVVPQEISADYEIRYASLWHYIKAWWNSRK